LIFDSLIKVRFRYFQFNIGRYASIANLLVSI